VYGDTGVAEMDGVTGSMYSGDPGVDSSYLVSPIISYLLIIPSHPLPMLLEPEPLFLTNPFWNAVRGAAEC